MMNSPLELESSRTLFEYGLSNVCKRSLLLLFLKYETRALLGPSRTELGGVLDTLLRESKIIPGL